MFSRGARAVFFLWAPNRSSSHVLSLQPFAQRRSEMRVISSPSSRRSYGSGRKKNRKSPFFSRILGFSPIFICRPGLHNYTIFGVCTSPRSFLVLIPFNCCRPGYPGLQFFCGSTVKPGFTIYSPHLPARIADKGTPPVLSGKGLPSFFSPWSESCTAAGTAPVRFCPHPWQDASVYAYRCQAATSVLDAAGLCCDGSLSFS